MIKLKFDNKAFKKELDNIIEYSSGFLEGVQMGKREFFNNLGPEITEQASQFIDANARLDYSSLHHVYEWGNTGDQAARLFDITYTVSNLGLSFTSNFRQSTSVQKGSTRPFYDKAEVMESGRSVVISPVQSEVLRFEVGGEVVYTKKPVIVNNPGGNTQGKYANVFDMFFGKYFTQSFLRSSGLAQYFNNPEVYKKNLSSGSRQGRSRGIVIGSRWIANAGKVA
jgi:hypothetical protein